MTGRRQQSLLRLEIVISTSGQKENTPSGTQDRGTGRGGKNNSRRAHYTCIQEGACERNFECTVSLKEHETRKLGGQKGKKVGKGEGEIQLRKFPARRGTDAKTCLDRHNGSEENNSVTTSADDFLSKSSRTR